MERVVVLRALGLGDLLTAVPALRGLRRAHPGAQLVLAAPRSLAPLARLTGAVDAVVDTAPLAPLEPSLAGADLAVNLHGRGPQSTALLRATAPRRLIAWGTTWRADEHEVARWCRLLREHDIACDEGDLALAQVPVEPAVHGAALVHPGAAQVSRHWPVERWAEVARGLSADGHDVRVTGGPDEVDRARAVADLAGLGRQAVLAGRTGLLQLAATVQAARLLVSVDTGVAHLATAVGTPSVVLFGPTPPALWGPPAGRPEHVALWAGRTGDNFADRPDEGLLRLAPAPVLAAARSLPARRSGSSAATCSRLSASDGGTAVTDPRSTP